MDDLQNEFQGEVDPAAEFLARDQSELDEIGIGGQLDVADAGDASNLMDGPALQEPIVNGFTDEIPSGTFTQASPPTSLMSQEPESLRKWREEKAELLRKLELEEDEEEQKWSEKAKKELDDWYNRYNEQLEKVQNENRAAQEEFIEEMSSTKPGNEWTKVARLCDFNPKVNKSTKDVSRMRGILLRLKQEPLVR